VGWEQYGDDSSSGVLEQLGNLLTAPLRIWHVLALAVVALGGLIYILRTGNVYLGLPIPQFDEGMRRFLENMLVFRPRTKEFLIGHPALMLAAAVALSGYWRISLPLVLIGCIGQISMINTFSHIHTPDYCYSFENSLRINTGWGNRDCNQRSVRLFSEKNGSR